MAPRGRSGGTGGRPPGRPSGGAGGRPPGRQGDGFWLNDAFETTHAFQSPGAYAPADAETTLPLPVFIEQGGRPRRRFRRFLYRATLTVFSLIACLAIGFGLLLVFTPSAGQATQIAARFARQHGAAYPGPPVPGNFAQPLIATEDHRFYSEIGGIDPLALVRAAKGAITGGPDQGGATLELQLAKLLYVGDNPPQHDGLSAKLTEVALAVKLDSMYSKAQILQLYAEVAYYGHGYYGLQQASCGYFGHPSADLTVTQGAMLAGVVNAPTLDDPIKYPTQAHVRLAHVIGRMVAVGDLTPGQGQAALSAPLGLTPGHSPNC
jgi:membrane peptidoglycan carboxypeptidase